MSRNIILNHIEIEHKISRIAFQIYEAFSDEECIILAGISVNGYTFAEKTSVALKKISNLKVLLCEVKVDKVNPFKQIITSIPETIYSNKGIILMDDVLNSGATLIYGVKHFLNVPVKKIKTAVLIDRNHKKFPIKADFKGISLSTSLKEHVHIVFEENNNHAYLT